MHRIDRLPSALQYTPMPNAPRAYLALIVTVFVWGVAPAFIRSFSQTIGAWDSIFIRLTSVALMALPFLFISGAYIARADWPRLLLVSCGGLFGYFLGSIFGFEYVKAGIGSMVIAVQPLVVALLAAALGTENLKATVVLGLIVSLAGVVLLVSGDAELSNLDRNALFGIAMIMLCNVAFAINIVFSKPLVIKYGAMRITFLSAILTALPALFFFRPSVIPVISNLDTYAWGTLFYLGFVGTIFVVVLWNYAVGILKPTTVGASLYAIPVLGALSGWIVLGETLTWQTLLGGAVIILGVALAEFAKSRGTSDTKNARA
jgi:drug/metabolite transporter (DMT)-like permease